MRKKGWILLLILLGVAFLMSCSTNHEKDREKAELVRINDNPESTAFLF